MMCSSINSTKYPANKGIVRGETKVDLIIF